MGDGGGARAAAAERAAAKGCGDAYREGNNKDDHDTQRLPMKCPMKIAMKNKNKANKLFSGDLEL